MPISAPFVSAKIALLRLTGFNTALTKLNALIFKVNNSGISSVQANAFINAYKQSLKNYLTTQVTLAANEALITALSAATESDSKNNMLTPLIAGIFVNPVAAPNVTEMGAMILEGANAAESLTELINKANSILS